MTKNLAYISQLTKVSLQLQHRALNNTVIQWSVPTTIGCLDSICLKAFADNVLPASCTLFPPLVLPMAEVIPVHTTRVRISVLSQVVSGRGVRM